MSKGKPAARPVWVGAVVVVLIVLAAWFLRSGSGAEDGSASPTGAGRSVSPRATATMATATTSTDPETGLVLVALSTLPVQARRTVALIETDGPYPYARDGIVFGNREGLLPKEKSGWYHEYTVPTPGSEDRGARRIVTGGPTGAGVGHGLDLFYSDDHYDSFRRIRVDS